MIKEIQLFEWLFDSGCDMNVVFQSILNGFLYDFQHDVRKCTEPIVGAAVEIYGRMSAELLPTPAKSHYVFNLRDLSKCVQGMCRSECPLCSQT